MLLTTPFLSRLQTFCLYFFWGAVTLITLVASKQYVGHTYIYLLFSILCNSLLYMGFREKALFFDAAIGTFLWLGFWLKLTLRIVYVGGLDKGFAGSFDGSGGALDYGLLVSCCGFAGLMLATVVRARFFYYKTKAVGDTTLSGLLTIYREHRGKILFCFICLVFFVGISNIQMGVYQRGQVAVTILPYGLSGVYKWLLQFGLASFGAVILQFEYVLCKRNSYVAAIAVLFEGLASSVSLLSRGMILNTTALFYGLFKSMTLFGVVIKTRFLAIILAVFFLFFVVSVLSVNYLRVNTAQRESTAAVDKKMTRHIVSYSTTALFVDRWVGIEGVLAVSGSEKKGWDLWRHGWDEVYSENKTSFFDLNLIDSPYLDADTSVNHYVSLPGLIAFCFYPGSFPFLFVCLFVAGIIGALCEIAAYKWGGKNLILCSLLAQVIAYRYSGFGYVPAQSYLLFGSLFLNVMIFFAADKAILSIRRNTANKY